MALSCTQHGKGVILVCEDCDDAQVCAVCVTQAHQGHTFVGLNKYPEKVRDKVQTAADENAKIVKHLENLLLEVRSRRRMSKMDGEKQEDLTKATIRAKGEQICLAINDLITFYCDVYDKHTNSQSADEREKELTEALQKARAVDERLETMLDSNTFSDIDEVVGMLEVPYSLMATLVDPEIVFSTADLDVQALMGMIGTLSGDGIFPENMALEAEMYLKQQESQRRERQKAKQQTTHTDKDDTTKGTHPSTHQTEMNGDPDNGHSELTLRTQQFPTVQANEEKTLNVAETGNKGSEQDHGHEHGRMCVSHRQSDMTNLSESEYRTDKLAEEEVVRGPIRVPRRKRRSLPSSVTAVVKSDFNTFGTRPVNVIRPVSSGVCWVNFVRENWIWLTDATGLTKRRVSMELPVKSLAVTSDGTLACLSEDQSVYKIDKDYKIHRFFRIPHLYPRDICIEPDQNLLISLVDCERLALASYSQRALARYTPSGQRVVMVERDQLQQRLFTWPFCVRVSCHGDTIMVVNKTAEDASHLVVLDRDLQLIYRYVGEGICVPAHEAFSTDQIQARFHPMDVVFDADDNFLLAEFYTRSVQLLSSCCSRLINIMAFNSIPRSMVYFDDVNIWVGLEDGSIKVLRLVKASYWSSS